MTTRVWSNVRVAVQSAIGAAVSITGISKAATAVVSYTGADPANGDYVLVKADGMYQMDYRLVRVANVNSAANSFECEGVDSTLFENFTSGSFQPVTFGHQMSTVTSISSSGGDFNQIDTTTIHNNVNTQQPGNANAMSFNLSSHWDPSNTALVALKQASDTKQQLGIQFQFADGARYLFAGYVGCTLAPGGSAQQKVETQIVFNVYGRPTAYAS